VLIAVGLIRTAVANLATERSTTVCVGLDFAIATGEVSARRLFVTAITSTTCALATSMIVAHMLQVANTTRETFASFFFFAAIPNVTASTATAIHATDLDEVGRACKIVAASLHRSGCCGRRCGRRRSLAALTIFAFNGTTESTILYWLQTISTIVLIAMGLISAAVANLTTE